ncbi:MAG: putative glycoside hydrolase [Clostridiaceae bacterium]
MKKNILNKKILIPVIIIISVLIVAVYIGFESKTKDVKKEVSFTEMSETEKAKRIKEREELEKQRKEQLGEFYVALPELGKEHETTKVKAKALYLSANVAGAGFNEENVDYYAKYILAISGQSGEAPDASRLNQISKLEKALAICKSTEINALVIDIKNDDGLVAWNSNIGIVNQIESNWSTPMKNYDILMEYMKKNNIYSIARIVAFKDPYFAKQMAAHAIQLNAGGVYKDKAGNAWVNPFDQYIWKYLVAISEEAALRGFDEIQYDYVRFPDGAKYYNPITEFPGRNGLDKDEGIEAFLKYASNELKPYNVNVAADVFGIITHSWDDKPEDIGQTWRKIANSTDYICPMIYPSHYGSGNYGFAVPDQHPYEILRLAVMEAIERNAAQKDPAIIRPWVQGFTATWVNGHINYNASAMASQIVACAELGVDEYIVWSASNNYDPMTFFYQDKINKNIRKSGEDILARTPEAALRKYLDAEKSRRYNTLYLLTPIGSRNADYDAFVTDTEKKDISLKSYELAGVEKNSDGTYTATVKGSYSSASAGTTAAKEVKYTIVLEKDVYKIIEPEIKFE